jgi:hypothetical protein
MERQRFVYGSFTWPGNEKPDPVSLEIVQEHGSNELIGKIYFKGVRECQWGGVSGPPTYTESKLASH